MEALEIFFPVSFTSASSPVTLHNRRGMDTSPFSKRRLLTGFRARGGYSMRCRQPDGARSPLRQTVHWVCPVNDTIRSTANICVLPTPCKSCRHYVLGRNVDKTVTVCGRSADGSSLSPGAYLEQRTSVCFVTKSPGNFRSRNCLHEHDISNTLHTYVELF